MQLFHWSECVVDDIFKISLPIQTHPVSCRLAARQKTIQYISITFNQRRTLVNFGFCSLDGVD